MNAKVIASICANNTKICCKLGKCFVLVVVKHMGVKGRICIKKGGNMRTGKNVNFILTMNRWGNIQSDQISNARVHKLPHCKMRVAVLKCKFSIY